MGAGTSQIRGKLGQSLIRAFSQRRPLSSARLRQGFVLCFRRVLTDCACFAARVFDSLCSKECVVLFLFCIVFIMATTKLLGGPYVHSLLVILISQ